jgi:hypothetical protein
LRDKALLTDSDALLEPGNARVKARRSLRALDVDSAGRFDAERTILNRVNVLPLSAEGSVPN